MSERRAFYCVCDARYFLGAVGMINSLRLQGHREPIYLLDLGLSAEQRELLGGEVSFVEAPAGIPPWLAKTIAPLRHPAETMVLIDADMIVTRPLTELIERAAQGRLVGFLNHEDRWVSDWGAILELGPLDRRPYLSSGWLAIDRAQGEELLGTVADRQEAIDFQRTIWRRHDPAYPFLYGDQDVFNAVIAARLDRDRVEALPSRLGAPLIFDDPTLVDPRTLRCRFEDGTEPYLLHHLLPAKPWLRAMHDGVYSRLLRFLLCSNDSAVRVPRRMIPVRLREGSAARLERLRVQASVRVRWALGTRVDRWLHRFGLPPRDPVPRA